MKKWKKCPLLLSIVLFMLAVTVIGAVGRNGIYEEDRKSVV